MGGRRVYGGSRANFKTISPVRQAHRGLTEDVWYNEPHTGGRGSQDKARLSTITEEHFDLSITTAVRQTCQRFVRPGVTGHLWPQVVPLRVRGLGGCRLVPHVPNSA